MWVFIYSSWLCATSALQLTVGADPALIFLGFETTVMFDASFKIPKYVWCDIFIMHYSYV